MKVSNFGYSVQDDVRMYRSLICFKVQVDDFWYVMIANWNHRILLGINVEDLPKEILKKAEPGFRCYAQVNAGEVNPNMLCFEDWELGLICRECERGVFESTGEYSNFTMRCTNCFNLQ